MKDRKVREREGGISELNPPPLFFSNKLEKLFSHLKEMLFSEGNLLFSSQLIVIPSPAIGQWLTYRLADECGVAVGLKMVYLTDALSATPPSPLSMTLWLAKRLPEIQDPAIQRYLSVSPKRTIELAQKLTHLFGRYGMYGATHFKQAWQKQLWDESQEHFPSIIDSMQQSEQTIHLFGHNHLPLPLFHHFEKQGAFFYLLSPCQEFWSELYSEAKLGENEQPLLVSLGRVGREMAKTVEESSVQLYEDYDAENLSSTQKSLLNLSSLKQDDSIEIHAASTPLREVQILKTNLLHLDVKPREVLVMAPDITYYAPYLRAVFGDLIHLKEMTASMRHEEVKAFLALLDLDSKRWSISSVKRVYTHSLCKWRFSQKDLHTIERWVKRTGIRWGYDEQMRKHYLGKSVKQGTWRFGVEQLLDELAHDVEQIDFPDSELLGEFIDLLDKLNTSLIPFREEHKTPSKWGESCLKLFSQFFDMSDGTLSTLLSPLIQEKETTHYSFQVILPIILDLLSKEKAEGKRTDMQVIACDSLRPMRALPAKVICLLGMNHDAFPRFTNDSLDALTNQAGVPQTVDFDRYLFLETLLSYRQKCLISYQGRDPYDGSTKPPSQVLELLLPHVKQIIHPLHGYDERYFNGELLSYNTNDYEQCLALKEKPCKAALFKAPQKISLPKGEFEIPLSNLLRAVRAPLKHYFHALNFSQRVRANEQDALTLMPLTLAKLRRLTLQHSEEDAIHQLQKQGELPTGMLFEAMRPRILSQVLVKPTKSYTFDLGVSKIEEIEEGCFAAPPLSLSFGSTTVHITGSLDGVCNKELILPDRGDLIGAIKWWPTILVSHLKGLSETWTFSKNQKHFESLPVDPQKAFEAVLGYYFQSEAQPSPLYPSVVPKLLKEECDLSQIWDPAFEWALETKEVGDEVVKWDSVAKLLYGELSSGWF